MLSTYQPIHTCTKTIIKKSYTQGGGVAKLAAPVWQETKDLARRAQARGGLLVDSFCGVGGGAASISRHAFYNT